jgi:LPS export ABC transporter protein LptC
MASWQRPLRLVFAVVAIGVAALVAYQLKRPAPSSVSRPPLAPVDPKAVAESTNGESTRSSKSHEDVQVGYDHLQSFPDGSTKLLGVRVVTQRAGDRTFTVTSKEAVEKSEIDFALKGNVHIDISDGMKIRTEQATYNDNEGVIRAPGRVAIERERLTGSSVGFTYDKTLNEMGLLGKVALHIAPDKKGDGMMNITAPSAIFDRQVHIIRFEQGLRAVRGSQVITADAGVAHLTDDENHLQAIELRGRSRITSQAAKAGELRSLAGRDVDLKYAADGVALEHALVTGGATIQVAGEPRQPLRQITGNVVNIALAPDGATPTLLTARENVQLSLPADRDTPARTISAQSLDCHGDADHGLTSAHFETGVRYHEQGPELDRTARSQALDARLGPGMATVEEARFMRAVKFEDGPTVADGAEARYNIDAGTLDLSGTEGAARPRVETDQIGVDADQIAMTLAGPLVKANGAVKSVLKHQKDSGSRNARAHDTKMPSMLKQDEDVIVTAAGLDYDGPRSKATYTGGVYLNQGDTGIKAPTIVIDDRSGDLSASGSDAQNVVSSITREEATKDKKPALVRTDAKSRDLLYEDATRRLTYSGNAYVNGSAGEMRAAKIEMYLTDSGDELERVEAFENITLKEPNGRVTTGNRLTYIGAKEEYTVNGTPVRVKDACGRDTTGKTLTSYRDTNRIVIDGDQSRAQTIGDSKTCP